MVLRDRDINEGTTNKNDAAIELLSLATNH